MSRVRYLGSLRACCALLLVALFAACGGGGGSGKPAAEASGDDDAHASSATAANEGEAEADEADEPAAKRNSCDDGTCSSCGSGMCMTGWYCDESAKGGPACGWLPACANKLSCACLTKTFSGCSCEEKSGGVHLTCG